MDQHPTLPDWSAPPSPIRPQPPTFVEPVLAPKPTSNVRKNIIIGILLLIVALFALGAYNKAIAGKTAAPTYVPITNIEADDTGVVADTEFIAMDAAFETKGAALCDALNEAVDGGLSRTVVVNYGVEAFFDSLKPTITRTPALEAHFRELIGTC